MTFKHAKFDDSPVMRSLEKVARDKGWVQSEPIKKSASNKVDLKPTSNLTNNILKLCEGLRASGFYDYASDVENKYITFKQAATLYEAFDETGEDIIDRAHPKGGTKLEDLDNAKIHTILEQQLEDLGVVNKEPTGKLATSNDILNAVKKALGAPSNKADGSAVKYKFGQDRAATAPVSPPEASSGITDMAIGTGATMGGVAGIKYLINRLRNTNSLSARTSKALFEELGEKPSKALLQQTMKKIEDEAGKGAINKVLGRGAEQAGEQALKQVVNTGVQKAEQQVGQQLALKGLETVEKKGLEEGAKAVARSPGAWSRILPWVARTAVSADSAVAGATATAGAAVASFAAAALIGAIGGSIIGSKLFDYYLAPDEIKDAGTRLLEQANSLKEDMSPEGQKSIIAFQSSFNEVLNNYAILQSIKENKNPQDLNGLKALSDALWKSNKHSQAIWGWAQDAIDNKSYRSRGGESGHWYSGILSPVTTLFQPFSNLVALAKNYMDVTNRITKLIDDFIYDISAKLNKAEEAQKAQIADKNAPKPGGTAAVPETEKVLKEYDDLQNTIDLYKERVRVRELPNAAALNSWLDKASARTTQYKSVLSGSKFQSDPEILNSSRNSLNSIKTKVDAFQKKWLP